jgi:hypothetical protein
MAMSPEADPILCWFHFPTLSWPLGPLDHLCSPLKLGEHRPTFVVTGPGGRKDMLRTFAQAWHQWCQVKDSSASLLVTRHTDLTSSLLPHWSPQPPALFHAQPGKARVYSLILAGGLDQPSPPMWGKIQGSPQTFTTWDSLTYVGTMHRLSYLKETLGASLSFSRFL